MSAKTTFYGIEEVPPTKRRKAEPYLRPGDSRRAYGWLKPSEYQRLLERERRQPVMAFYGALTAFVIAFTVYVLT